MTDHREQNSSCPVTWDDEPRGFLTEWEATSMKPTEDAKMGNDEAERLIAALSSQIGDDVSVIFNHESLFKRSRDLIRTQSARIAELEAERDTAARDYCNLMDRHDAHFVAWQSAKARAEAAEARERALLACNNEERKALVQIVSLKSRLKAAKAEVARLKELLGDALDAWDTHNETGDMMDGYWVSDTRAALDQKEAGK